jgi:lactate dehydrogenase-like 2-hydroxyacid dehydrogenase
VFEHEPAIDPRYLTLENAFLMPHLAAETIKAQTAGCSAPCMAALFVKIQVAERLRAKRYRMFRRARPPRR